MVPTAQAVIAAYEALYDHIPTLYVSIGEDGKLCGAIGWWEVCTEDCDHCALSIDENGEEEVFEAEGDTLEEVLADLAAQLRKEQAQTPVTRLATE